MQLFVFVGAPDLITHLGLRTPQGSHNGRMADVIVMRDLAQAFALLANHGRLRAPGALPAWAWVRTLRRVSCRQLARRSRAPGCELARPRLGMTGKPKCLYRSAW